MVCHAPGREPIAAVRLIPAVDLRTTRPATVGRVLPIAAVRGARFAISWSSANRLASIVTFSVGARYGDSPLIHRFPRFRFALPPNFQDAPVSDNDFQIESHAFSEVDQISREGGCVTGKEVVPQKLSACDTSVTCHPIIGHDAIERLRLPLLSGQIFGERLEILRKLEYIVHP